VIYSHVNARWIDELESTKHAQTTGALCRRNVVTEAVEGKCCLGVLALDVLADADDPLIPPTARVRTFIDDKEAHGHTFVASIHDDDEFPLYAQYNVLPSDVAYAVGLTGVDDASIEPTRELSQEDCYRWNDQDGLGFKQIAHKIRLRMGFTFV
jgi:hypothetical protein